MRYKALPVSVRSATRAQPQERSRLPSGMPDWLATALMLLVIPGLLIPLFLVAAAGESLTLSPSQALAGTRITAAGAGYEPGTRIQLAFDGATSGYPKLRVGRGGAFSATLGVPLGAIPGSHAVQVLDARRGHRSGGGGSQPAPPAVLASAVLMVMAPASPTPIPATPAPTPSSPPTSTASPSSVPAPTPAPSSGSDPQPTLPIRAAFYYPWFPEAWAQQGIDPFTKYHPALGYYDNSDPRVIAQHVEAMTYGNIEVGISSWWGQRTPTDGRLPAILDATAGSAFRWTIYYEPEGYADPSVAQLAADLTYLRDQYGSDPSFFRIGGRFVVFVYADAADACGMVDRWLQANASVNAYLVLKVFSGYRTCGSQPPGWHQYSPAVAEDNQAGYSFSISPGFDKANESSPRLARDLARWYTNVRNMVASGAPFQLVTTFSEWGEGTIVESATEWASSSGYGAYLDALHTNGVGGSPGTPPPTPMPPTPVPTVAPTSPPTPAPTPGAGGAVLVGAGDIASCSGTGDEATAALLDTIGGTVFTTGDNVYDNGTAAEFANCYDPSWGRHTARTLPAPGNHDYNTSGAAGYFGYFGSRAGDPSRGYYAYDLGGWRVYAINSNCGEIGGCGVGSPQHIWLTTDLATNPRQCVAAYWHHPRWSSGAEHGSDTSVGPIWEALYNAGAEVVLAGHDHLYERFAPQNGAGQLDSARGVREFVVGTGGRSHYSFGTILPNSEARNATAFGVLKLTLSTGSYAWNFVPVAGQTYTDAGSTACH